MSGKVTKVSGPLVVAEGLVDANVADVVRVGEKQLIGEILNMTGDSASIQVYEETSGLGPGAEVVTTGSPLSVELGPGLLENIYDGIQRPLEEIRAVAGHTIARGIFRLIISLTKTFPQLLMPFRLSGARIASIAKNLFRHIGIYGATDHIAVAI